MDSISQPPAYMEPGKIGLAKECGLPWVSVKFRVSRRKQLKLCYLGLGVVDFVLLFKRLQPMANELRQALHGFPHRLWGSGMASKRFHRLFK